MKLLKLKMVVIFVLFLCASINAQEKNTDNKIKILTLENTSDSKFDKNYNKGVEHYNAAVSFISKSEYITVNEIDEAQKKSLEQINQALPYFEKAYKINPKNKNVLHALSGCYFSLNDKLNYEKYQKELNELGR